MRRSAILAALVFVASSLGAQSAPESTSAPLELVDGQRVVMTAGFHRRVVFDRVVERVAVGDETLLTFELLSDREILLLGRAPGRTTLLAWFADGRSVGVEVLVQPALTTTEARLLDAIRPVGGARVTVRRLQQGAAPDDLADTFVLEGSVPTQVDLARVLHVARRALPGVDGTADADIRVEADESGAFVDIQGGNLNQNQGGALGGGGQGFTLNRNGGGGQVQQQLQNRIGTNAARASVLSAANGRLLSLLVVDDLPQVRVDVQIYEVSRSALRDQGAELAVIMGDQDQAPLLPAGVATAVQGDGALGVGDDGESDIQNVLGFLADGFSNQFQVSGEHYAIDALLSLLESRGIARSLSHSSVTTLSGEIGQFLVGGEVPIQTSFAPAFGTGSNTGATPGVFNTVQFRPFGVQLSIRPLVGERDMLTLDVIPEVSQPSADLTAQIRESTGTDLVTTGFETRSLRTSARMRDGQALVIGGLVSRSATDASARTPWLHRIPLIGWLFQRNTTGDDDLELVVVVAPEVVREPIEDLDVWAFPTSGDVLDALAAER